MRPNEWQAGVRDEVLELLHSAGVEAKVAAKVARVGAEAEQEEQQEQAEGDGGSRAEAARAAQAGEGEADGEGEEMAAAEAAMANRAEVSIVIKFKLGRAAFEVWVYSDEAGVLEPGDDWWPFDRDEFESGAALAGALVAHVRDILDEASEA